MNKKYLIFGITLLSIALISAVVGYYAIFSATITVNPSITLSDCSDSLTVLTGETFVGKECILTNIATTDRNLVITNNADVTTEGIEVSYMGSLTMVEKDTTLWTPITGGDTKTIQYTVVGDKFIVTEIPEGYTLIYYPNTEGDIFATNVANVKVLTEGINVGLGNLPIALDVGDDYCNIGEPDFNPDAKQCVGAKLWLIKGTELEALAKLNSWDADEFLFETELIQYNADGEITLSPGASLTITPVYKIGAGATGGIITTTVA